MDVIRLTEVGEKLGYNGESRRQFVENETKKAAEKERQQMEREDRAREREERAKVEEHKRELEKKEIERQQAEEDHKRDLEKQEKERQAEEEHKRGLEKQEKERELLRKEKEEEHRRELEKRDKDMEMIKLKMTMGKDQTEAVTQNVTIHKPKLPKFEEYKDDMDIYLQRFERFAKMQKWKPEEWVVSLSTSDR